MNTINIESCINSLELSSEPLLMDKNGNVRFIHFPKSFRDTLSDAAYNNALLINSMKVSKATDVEVPTLYALFDVTVRMIECLTLSEFITKFQPDTSDNRYKDAIVASMFILENGLDTPLGKNALNAIREYSHSICLLGFFWNLIRVASSMARLSGQSNPYNDFRLQQNIQADFKMNCEECYCEECPNYETIITYDMSVCSGGDMYVYATGETLKMQKSYKEYQDDISRYRENWLNVDKHFKYPMPPMQLLPQQQPPMPQQGIPYPMTPDAYNQRPTQPGV